MENQTFVHNFDAKEVPLCLLDLKYVNLACHYIAPFHVYKGLHLHPDFCIESTIFGTESADYCSADSYQSSSF